MFRKVLAVALCVAAASVTGIFIPSAQAAQTCFETSTAPGIQDVSGVKVWDVGVNQDFVKKFGLPDRVEFWVNNSLKATVSKNEKGYWTYVLDTTTLRNGKNLRGFRMLRADGTVICSSPALPMCVANDGFVCPKEAPVEAPVEAPITGGNLVKFGSFDNGNLSEFSDASCHPERVAVHRGGGPNGTNWARFTADDSIHCYGNDRVRNHMLGLPSKPAWFNNGHVVWRAISIRMPSVGNTNQEEKVLDEVHFDNGTGPADNTPTAKPGGYWRFIVRGGSRTDGNYAWQQIFGPNYSGTLIPGIQGAQDWKPANHRVVGDEWVHFRYGMRLAPDKTGWFEAWARWGNMTQWINIVPRMQVPTSYPDKNGDGRAAYPIMSLYYGTGGGGSSTFDYADGAWSDNYNTLAAWQDARLGFSPDSQK